MMGVSYYRKPWHWMFNEGGKRFVVGFPEKWFFYIAFSYDRAGVKWARWHFHFKPEWWWKK